MSRTPEPVRTIRIVSETVLLVAFFASGCAENDPAELIRRLGAGSFEERVAAYQAPGRLGKDALPALRAAADADGGDPEVRSRARALIAAQGDLAEPDRLSKPTLVRLDFHDRPLGEVTDTLDDRHDFRLDPQPDLPPQGSMQFGFRSPQELARLRNRRVTLETPEPLPFWEAVDRICQAASVRYAEPDLPGFGTGRGLLYLIGDRAGRGTVSDTGPFRVELLRILPPNRADAKGDLGPAIAGSTPASKGLALSLAVFPEPDLGVFKTGPATLEEAIDDRGRSMMPNALPPPNGPQSLQVSGHGMNFFKIDLAVPTPAGAKIRRLRGRVPAVVFVPKANPVVVELTGDGLEGKTVRFSGFRLTLDKVALRPEAEISLKVSVHWDTVYYTGVVPQPPFPVAPGRVELYDASGRKIKAKVAQASQVIDINGEGFYYRLVVPPAPGAGTAGDPDSKPGVSGIPIPAELRYYRFTATEVDIPFDLHDIPMP